MTRQSRGQTSHGRDVTKIMAVSTDISLGVRMGNPA